MKRISLVVVGLLVCAFCSSGVFAGYIVFDGENLPNGCYLGFYKNDVPTVADKTHLADAKLMFYSKPDVKIKLSSTDDAARTIANDVFKVIAVVCGKKHYVCNYDHKRDTFDLHMREDRVVKVEAKRRLKPEYTSCRLPGHRYQS